MGEKRGKGKGEKQKREGEEEIVKWKSRVGQ